MRRGHLSIVVLLGSLLGLPRLEAQTFELGPAIGGYLPLGSFQNPAYFSTALRQDPSELAGRALGGHARVRLSPRFGVQLEATVAFSHVGGGAAPGVGMLPSTAAKVGLATLQATYYLTLPSQRTQVWLAAGPGVVRYG